MVLLRCHFRLRFFGPAMPFLLLALTWCTRKNCQIKSDFMRTNHFIVNYYFLCRRTYFLFAIHCKNFTLFSNFSLNSTSASLFFIFSLLILAIRTNFSKKFRISQCFTMWFKLLTQNIDCTSRRHEMVCQTCQRMFASLPSVYDAFSVTLGHCNWPNVRKPTRTHCNLCGKILEKCAAIAHFRSATNRISSYLKCACDVGTSSAWSAHSSHTAHRALH